MSIRTLKGSYWVDFRHAYNRVRKRSPVQTMTGAKDYEALLRSRLMRGEPLEGPRKASAVSFSQFAWEWHEAYVKANNKESEQYNKAIYLRVHLVPFFGKMNLGDIAPEHIERYKAKKRGERLGDSTINLHLTTLAKCLKCAQEWNRILLAPHVAKIKASRPPKTFLTPQESEKLLTYVGEHSPAYYDLILLALRTGMRRGELLGLQWGDVDLERREITVRHSLVRGILSCPKSYKVRYIKMTGEVSEMLSRRRSRGGYVFHTESGDAWSYATIDRNLKIIGRNAGLPNVHWHAFRHTFASQLVSTGVPLHVVKELLGHSDIKMTMDYAHFAPSLYDGAVNVLDTLGKQAPVLALGQPVGNQPLIAAPTQTPEILEIGLMCQQKQAIM